MRDRWPTWLLGAALAALLLIAATGGPDCLRYLDWSRAAESADIFELPARALSPFGLPLSQWSPGPGLLYALPGLLPWPYGLVPAEALGPLDDFRGMGWLAALALWWGMFRTLRHLSSGAAAPALFVAGAAFTGTHLGFYSLRHASESLSFGCLALLLSWLLIPRRWRPLDVLFVSTLCALLLTIRAHLAPYAVLGLGMLIHRLRHPQPAPGPRQWAGHAVLGAVPLLAALMQLVSVNRWMTGSWLQSAYSFGSGSFASLDWSDPELFAVLLHPWHGFLVYHPLYGLCFALLIAQLIRARTSAERWLFGGLAVALAVHLYLQAAWYCWWLGVGTFGMRGMGPAAIVLLPLLARVFSRRSSAGRKPGTLVVAVLAACFWSFLLMIQGATNFMTFAELLLAQARTLARTDVLLPLVTFGALAATLGRMNPDRARFGFTAGAVLLVALSACHLWDTAIAGAARTLPALPARLLLACAIGAAAALAARGAAVRPARAMRPALLLPAVVLGIFVAVNVLFVRLAFRTERYIFDGVSAKAAGSIHGVDLREVDESYAEYLRVPGFDAKKAALAEFLRNSGPSE